MMNGEQKQNGIKILHVDDEPDFLKLTKDILEMGNKNFSVETVTSAEEGLELLRSDKCDVVISDYKMHGMDGLRFLQNLRQGGNLIPFIIFTGKGREEAAIEALNRGANYYLQKGGDIKSLYGTLAHAIKEVVEKKRAVKALRESEERLRGLFSNAVEGIYRSTLDGKILEANPALLNFFGYENEEEFKEIGAYQTFTNREDREKFLRELEEKGEVRGYEIEYKRKDGKVVIGNEFTRLIEEGGRKVIEGIIHDITESKRAEETLRISEAKYLDLYENANDIIYTIDLQGRFTSANRAARTTFGYRNEEIPKLTLSDVLLPEDAKLAWKRFQKTVTSKSDQAVQQPWEYKAVRKDGSILDIEVRTRLLWENGQIVGSQGIARDITERKRIERELKESEKLYKSLFEFNQDILAYSPAGIMRLDKEMKIEYENPTMKKIIGVPLEGESKAMGIDIRALPSVKEAGMLPVLNELLEGKEIIWEGTFTSIYGKRTHLSVKGVSIYENGDFACAVLLINDITERKQAEEKIRSYALALEEGRDSLEKEVEERTKKLRESESKYRSLFEHTGTAMWISEEDTRISLVNKEMEALSGYSSEEIEGKKSWIDFVYPDDLERVEKYHDLRRKGEKSPTNYELKFVDREGDIKNIYITVGLIPGTKKSIASLIDITELKQMEEKLHRSERLATIGEFSSGIAHELRQPLGVINNSAYFLNMKLKGVADEKVVQYLGILEKEVQGANRIISDVLDFARLETPSFGNCDVNQIVEETISTVDIPPNVEVKKELKENLPMIQADFDRIQRVCSNIIGNAISVMPEGGSLGIKTETNKEEGNVEISFSDTGEGIAKENMEKIFEPLFTTTAKGIGLGLALCKKYVEAHQGTIEVESEVGKGSEFVVKLPVSE